MFQFSSIQSLTCVRLFATPWTATCQASLSITNSWNAQTHVHQVSDVIHHHLISYPCHLIFCRPLLHLPSIFPSLRVFSNESVLCIKWPKYWTFSFSLSPSNEYSGLISFRIDRLISLQSRDSTYWLVLGGFWRYFGICKDNYVISQIKSFVSLSNLYNILR